MAARKTTTSARAKSATKKKTAKKIPATTTRSKRATASKKKVKETGPYACPEIVALTMGGLCVMILLALISYSPADLPAWVPFSAQADQNASVENFIGPVGAVVAGYIYFFLGAAGFLIPAVLAWWGVQVVGGFRPFHARNVLSFIFLAGAAACLLEYQTVFLKDWASQYNLPRSSGGLVGYAVGHKIIERAMGPAGSVIVVMVIYMIALIVVTGIHPIQFALMVKQRATRFFESLRDADWAFPLQPPASVDELRKRQEAERKKPTVKNTTKTARKEKPKVEEMQGELALDTPAPDRKIIDASQRKTKPGEVMDSLFPDGRKSEASMLTGGHFENYKLPPLSLLNYSESEDESDTDESVLIDLQNTIVNTLDTFGVSVDPGDITKGPTITRYEVYPAPGLRVNKITSLSADLARATRAEKINILAPVPGKDTVGIEIANSNRVPVALRELFEDDAFRKSKAKLPLALGKDVYGRTIVGDLAKMPHLLVAGATGSGKSVCINGIIASLLYRFTPDELRFIMIDPKVVEMQLYNKLPHMVVPVVTDPKKVLLALRWVINEMERRYALFAKMGTRNFDGFNEMRAKERAAEAEAAAAAEAASAENGTTEMEGSQSGVAAENSQATLNDIGEPALALSAHHVMISDELAQETGFLKEESAEPDNGGGLPPRGTTPLPSSGGGNDDEEDIPDSLPYIVVIIDELADLMQTAPADVETGIARIAQKARAAGIHLIVATQTPRADVVTGIIKANVPSRIAFQVSSKMDSRIILDENGAENLVGKGDMLYLPPGSAQLVRAQGALITDEEAQDLVEACAAQGEPKYEAEAREQIESGSLENDADDISDADEEILEKCLEVIYTEKKASTSLLQRRLRLGYTRAARMIDILESRGVIGPGEGAKPREILVDLSDDLG